MRRESTSISNKEYEIKNDILKLRGELDQIARNKNDINNVRTDKLNKLKQGGRATQDVYSAIEWIHRNKHSFKGSNFFDFLFLILNLNF